MLKGIKFIVDNRGRKKSVVLDIKKWGKYWEDFYDILVSDSRRNQPAISWEKIKKETSPLR